MTPTHGGSVCLLSTASAKRTPFFPWWTDSLAGGRFIWLLAAFLGAAVFLGLYALLQVLLLWKAKADRYKAAPPPTGVNPLDNSFDMARIRFLDFADPVTRIVEGKTFVDCEFYGPATVVFSGCSFDGWRGAMDCDFVVLRADQETFSFSNVIMVKNSFFKDCKFLKLVLLFNKSTKDDLDRLSRGAIKWITNP